MCGNSMFENFKYLVEGIIGKAFCSMFSFSHLFSKDEREDFKQTELIFFIMKTANISTHNINRYI